MSRLKSGTLHRQFYMQKSVAPAEVPPWGGSQQWTGFKQYYQLMRQYYMHRISIAPAYHPWGVKRAQ